MGLVQQAIESAPRWSIKKLTATYLTLGLSEIGKEVGIASEDDTRKVVLDMVSFRSLRRIFFNSLYFRPDVGLLIDRMFGNNRPDIRFGDSDVL